MAILNTPEVGEMLLYMAAQIIITILVGVCMMWHTYKMANRKGYSPKFWMILSMIFSFIPWVVMLFLPDRKVKENNFD